ncbi:MAG: selenium cofactor biosynthesis protein YqeC [bacterium]|jgi:probable selenium-dependent hydroxylase accessory protein YqeC
MAITLRDALDLNSNDVISLVGGGGKTTLLYWLAQELHQQGVILTTTTKMKHPLDAVPLVLWENQHQVQEELKMLLPQKTPLVANCLLPEQKVQGLSLKQVQKLTGLKLAETLVIEADGAKGCSLKGYRNFEPVLTPLTSLLIQVVGADVIGKQLNSMWVHGAKQVAAHTGVQLGDRLDVNAVAQALLYPYARWQDCLIGARRVVVINKVDTMRDMISVKLLATRLLESGRVSKVLLTSAYCGQVLQTYSRNNVF